MINKIAICSDIHGDMGPGYYLDAVDADLLIVAGDVCEGANGHKHIMGACDKIVYVAGNHEYYKHEIVMTGYEIGVNCTLNGINFLNPGVLKFENIRILGCTLWTDFALYGDAEAGMEYIEPRMNDFWLIKINDHYDNIRFRPENCRQIHLKELAWLCNQLEQDFDGLTVVVTHHAPHYNSIHYKYRTLEPMMNIGYATNLEWMMQKYKIDLWVHGHTHNPFDYVVENTRVICNPKGYPYENKNWKPVIIDVNELGPMAALERRINKLVLEAA